MFRWKEEKHSNSEISKEKVTIRQIDTPYLEHIEVYNEKGMILEGKSILEDKEKRNYLAQLSKKYPNAITENISYYDIQVDEVVSETIELYHFFPRQLETLIQKNIYDIYERDMKVHVHLNMEDNYYPVSFSFEDETDDKEKLNTIIQIHKEYGNGEVRGNMEDIFENMIKDITGKKVHKLEIDREYGYHKDPSDWLNQGEYAYDYEAKLKVYVK